MVGEGCANMRMCGYADGAEEMEEGIWRLYGSYWWVYGRYIAGIWEERKMPPQKGWHLLSNEMFYYAKRGFSSLAKVTIRLIPSSARLPFLNSFSTSARRTCISCRKASSKALTFLTGTSRSRPWVP